MGRRAFTDASRRALDPERALAALAARLRARPAHRGGARRRPRRPRGHARLRAASPRCRWSSRGARRWRACSPSTCSSCSTRSSAAACSTAPQVAVFLCVVGVFLVGLRAPTRDLVIGAVAAVGLLTATSLLEGASGDAGERHRLGGDRAGGHPGPRRPGAALAQRAQPPPRRAGARDREQPRRARGGGGAGRAHPDRARAARRRRPRRLGHARPGRGRQAHRARPTPSAPAPPSPRSRTPGARRSASCGACSASCGAATRSSRWRRSPRWSGSARSCSACARPGCPSSSRWAATPSTCRPASTPPPSASSRRRSSTSLRHAAATARARARRLRARRPSSSSSATTARGGDGPIRDGRGLVSLRERVALYGGELRAGRRRPRGFELRARLPVGEPAA